MRDAFETLIKSILRENPSAGGGSGAGVFGSGEENRCDVWGVDCHCMMCTLSHCTVCLFVYREAEDASGSGAAVKIKKKKEKKGICLIL